MFIALNGQRLGDSNPAGPEKYTYNIYSALSKIDRENEYVIYFQKNPGEKYFREMTTSNRNFSYKIVNSSVSWTQYGLAKQLFKDMPDILFTPVHTLPVFRPSKIKYVSMVHGLEFSHIKPRNLIRKLALGKTEKYVCKYSDKIIVPSAATKNAIIDRGWRDAKDIEIVSEGVGDFFRKTPENEITKAKSKYNIGDSNYILFIGTVHPRKNLPRTIEAFGRAMSELNDKSTKLVIAGKLGWDYEKSLESPAKHGLNNRVLFVGRVPDDDVPPLLSGALALANFSLEEGFGLPLLEAMACEVRCAVSEIPSFREVCGDLASYGDPYNIEDIKKCLVDVLTTPSRQIIDAGKERAKMFSWEESARKTLAVFQNLFKNS